MKIFLVIIMTSVIVIFLGLILNFSSYDDRISEVKKEKNNKK